MNRETAPIQKKILSVEDAARIIATERADGRIVVLAHGVFDLLHIGHVRHLGLARAEGDVLVVSITEDRFVNKGPGRPVFTAHLRAEMLANLDIVDWVVINPAPTAVPVLEALRPSIYVKGSEYANAEEDVTGKIVDERLVVERHGGRLVFTDDVVFSSSTLINRHLDVYPAPLREYLDIARERDWLNQLTGAIDALADKCILLVGDAIIDEYQYVETIGKAAKENIIATRYRDKELFAGGVFASANHLAGFCRQVDVITCLGATDSREDVIRAALKPNVKLHLVYRPDAPTTRKCRFVDPSYVRKLFEVYFFDDQPLPKPLQAQVDHLIGELAPQADCVVVNDFGHGLISDSTVARLQHSARFLAVNAQCNAGNNGFNHITKYPRADYICIDEPEARLAMSDKYSDIETLVADKLARRILCDKIIITRGSDGCLVYDQGNISHIPAFTKTVVDTVGAGDSFLCLSASIAALGAPLELAGFAGNAAGGLKVGIVGHRQSVEKPQIVKYVTALLK